MQAGDPVAKDPWRMDSARISSPYDPIRVFLQRHVDMGTDAVRIVDP